MRSLLSAGPCADLAKHVFAVMGWLAITSCALAAGAANQLLIYPVSEGMPRNSDYSLKARTPGQKWQDVPAYAVKVAQGIDTSPPSNSAISQSRPKDSQSAFRTVDSSIASFDFSGTIDVSITYGRGQIKSARVRPFSYGITPIVRKNTITFSLSQPRNLSVEVNGDVFHNLQLFANAIEDTRPNPADPNVIYYGPGRHRVGRVVVGSGKTIYLAGGALVEGAFLINHVENVNILGRGILYQPSAELPNRVSSQKKNAQDITPSQGNGSRHDALLIEFAKNVVVDGIIVVPNSYTVLVGESQNVTIKNIKSFSAGGNNDGIDVFDSSGVLIDGVFMRNSDDTIAIYGHRWNYYGDTRRVTVQNSTLWADVAHPILVGTHGDSTNPETLEDLTFLNIDILDHREPQLDYQGCLSLNAGDSNLIRNVRFENIRVEDFRQGQLVNLRVFYNRKYNTSPGGGIENVVFKDITYNGTHANPSIIAGYDHGREVKNIVFENLRINGRVISDDMPGKPPWFKTADMADIFVGEHVENVVFHAVSENAKGSAAHDSLLR